MITIEPDKVTAILIASAGWENIVPGSLKLDSLELIPASPTSEAEDYGFVAVAADGAQIIGRLSALLGTRRAAR